MSNFLASYLPAQFDSLPRLALRAWRNGQRPGRLAVLFAGLGLALTPADLLLSVAERRRYRMGAEPTRPLIFVCGPPRSGTTLVAQVLIRYLPVAYFNNLTSLFPRSPLSANALFRRWIRPYPVEFSSYYGKSDHLSGPNDALYLWDRWCGGDRTRVPGAFDSKTRAEIRSFFAAVENFYHLPLVNKNNSLNAFAALIADTLPTAQFICLDRDPVFLAQSLLIARDEIVGDPGTAYGLRHRAAAAASPSNDPVEDVCRQVVFHQAITRQQRERIGPERFHVIAYESFCAAPQKLVRWVAEDILREALGATGELNQLQPFQVSRKLRLDERTLAEIRTWLRALASRRSVDAAERTEAENSGKSGGRRLVQHVG
jgi:Sulfotransferase family